MKRFLDAVEHGDSIYAVIRGSAINNDGLRGGRRQGWLAAFRDVGELALRIRAALERTYQALRAFERVQRLFRPRTAEIISESLRAHA